MTPGKGGNSHSFSGKARGGTEKAHLFGPRCPKLTMKDKFITQSAPGIQRKLPKLTFGPHIDLEGLLEGK